MLVGSQIAKTKYTDFSTGTIIYSLGGEVPNPSATFNGVPEDTKNALFTDIFTNSPITIYRCAPIQPIYNSQPSTVMQFNSISISSNSPYGVDYKIAIGQLDYPGYITKTTNQYEAPVIVGSWSNSISFTYPDGYLGSIYDFIPIWIKIDITVPQSVMPSNFTLSIDYVY